MSYWKRVAGCVNGERFRVYSINFTGEGFRIGCTERGTITVGVTADSAVTPTVIVVIVTVIVVAVVLL